MSLSVCLCVCLSVAYIGPKSRTERPRKTKIGTEVAHVTHDSEGALKMQDQKMQDQKMADQIAGHENAGPENGGPSRNAASLCS